MNTKHLSKAYPPNPALEIFTPFLGAWQTLGTHGMIPNTTLHGLTTFTLHESGAFIVVQSTIHEKVGIPDGLAIIGSDDALGTYIMIYYDERGVSRHYQLSLKDNVMRWWREAPGFSQRTTLTLSQDKETIVGKGEISQNGAPWEQDLNLTYSSTNPFRPAYA